LRNCAGNVASRHHVGDGEAPARLEDAEGLGEHAVLVGGEIDDAVRNDHVDRIVGQRNGLDLALEKLDVGRARLALIVAGQRQHLVGHVEAIGLALRADAARDSSTSMPPPEAEIEHGFARLQLGERGRVAAAERGEHGRFGQGAGLALAVKLGGDRVVAGKVGARSAARSAADATRGLRVLVAHDVLMFAWLMVVLLMAENSQAWRSRRSTLAVSRGLQR